MVALQLLMVPSQAINLTLALVVSSQESLESVSQLSVETVPGIEGGSKIVLHDVCLFVSENQDLALVSIGARLPVWAH